MDRAARLPRGVPTAVLAATLCVVWSGAFVAVKLGLRSSSPMTFAALRALIAAPATFGLLALTQRRRTLAVLRDRRAHGHGVLLGMTNVAGFFALQNLGLERSGIGFGAVLIYSQPLLVGLLATLVLRERLTGRQRIGLLVGWLGVVVTVSGDLAVRGGSAAAAVILLAAALVWAVGTVLIKRIPPDLPLTGVLFLQCLYGALPLTALAVTVGGPVRWDGTLLGAAAYAGAVATAGGFGMQFALLQRGAAGVVSSYIFAVPVLSTGLGVLIFGERVPAGLAIGVLGVGLGVVLVTRSGSRTLSVPAEGP